MKKKMSNPFFQFRQFKVFHEKSSMKVGTDAVLIPCLTDFSNAQKILDVGCGSGVISLMCAQLSNAEILAIDIHKNSVEQAQENFNVSPWANRLISKHISFQEFAKQNPGKFDLIISNPPFFKDSMKSPEMNRNLARHTDALSQRDILNSARSLLKLQGILSLILPLTEGEEMILKAKEEGFHLKTRVNIKPKSTKSVNRIVIQFSLNEQKVEVRELIIREENNEYTKAYKELTKDFYLAL
jgi:tRNA1Val (adenine37-N6)-methyltransferase